MMPTGASQAQLQQYVIETAKPYRMLASLFE